MASNVELIDRNVYSFDLGDSFAENDYIQILYKNEVIAQWVLTTDKSKAYKQLKLERTHFQIAEEMGVNNESI